MADQTAATQQNTDKFVKLVKQNLDKAGVNVTEDALRSSLTSAREQLLADCEQCANGWRW